ncbi:hypothetical protein [Roseivivax isoporae]|uniref:Uncharacterized protein n=1 Tax=Roseivivax isoporae LMG 25204 TaxID=1449351 RepID=X7FBM9_9RHOB|nr:hypothetical protein [Roseivivax isoporae]ETX29484.1 hypothetical protein RISW2_23395 [Roseivivax isoporae LMG 25204]
MADARTVPDLKAAILEARYVDMIALADFVVRDCGLPDMDEQGEMLPQQNEIAAAIFRWAAGAKLGQRTPRTTPGTRDETQDDTGDPLMDAAEAEARAQAARPGQD